MVLMRIVDAQPELRDAEHETNILLLTTAFAALKGSLRRRRASDLFLKTGGRETRAQLVLITDMSRAARCVLPWSLGDLPSTREDGAFGLGLGDYYCGYFCGPV